MAQKDAVLSILFVCTGNLVRSPIAKLTAMTRWSSLEPQIEFSSAGTYALTGAPPPAEAIIAADQIGVNIRGHRATLLTEDLIHSADLILVAERSHRAEIAALVPASSKYVFTIEQFARIATALQGSEFAITAPLASRETALAFVSAVAQSRDLAPVAIPSDDDIDDPYRLFQADYDRAAVQIESAVNRTLWAFRY